MVRLNIKHDPMASRTIDCIKGWTNGTKQLQPNEIENMIQQDMRHIDVWPKRLSIHVIGFHH